MYVRRDTEDLDISDKIFPRSESDRKMEGLKGGLATGAIPENGNGNVQVDVVVDSFLELARVLE